MVIAIMIIWYIIGVAGFIYWWRTEHDLELVDLPIVAIVGFTGPFAWASGYTIHSKTTFIIWKKRR